MQDLFSQEMPRRDFMKFGAMAAGASLLLPELAHAKSAPMPEGHRPLKRHTTLAEGMALLEQQTVDVLQAKDFSHLLGSLEGLSDLQLKQHFKLYENYVQKTNLIHEQIAKADADVLAGANPSYSAYRSLHVEQSFNHNGVVFHELYFGNLGAADPPSQDLQVMINRDFGSWENYLKHLVAVGKAMRGWAVTGFDMRDGHLRNFGLDVHNVGTPTHFYPILVLDVYEHAYFTDYGTDRAKYLEAFVKNVNWNVVNQRLLFAVHHLMSGPAATR